LRWIARRAQRGGFNQRYWRGGDQARAIRHQARNIGGDNEFRAKTWFYCTPGGWLVSGSNTNRSKPVRHPKPFTVFQPTPGQNPKPLFVIHAYSLEVARALVAATVAGETIVVAVSRDGASR
jgi:hypothetical protein